MSDPILYPSLAPDTAHERMASAWRFGGCTCGWEAPGPTVTVGAEQVDPFEAHLLVVRSPSAYVHRNMTVEDQRASALRLNSPTVETEG